MVSLRDPPARVASAFAFQHRNPSPLVWPALGGVGHLQRLVRAYVMGLQGRQPMPKTHPSMVFFSIPQADYLRHIDCKHDELHLLCTERLNEMWAEFVDTFADRFAKYEERHRHARLNSSTPGFSPGDGEYLRQHLSSDYLLWLAACNATPGDRRGADGESASVLEEH